MSRRTTIVPLLAGILVLTASSFAFGKGPESVTITGPGIDSPIQLMEAVDWPISCGESCPPDAMVRLLEQSGLWYATGDLPRRIEKPPGDLGPRHLLAWTTPGLPDGSVGERSIRQAIYLNAENGPVIHTPDQKGLEGWGSGVVGWFRASDDLADTLASLGVPLSEPGAARAGAGGVTYGLGLLAAIGSAMILLAWAGRRRLAPTGPRRAEDRDQVGGPHASAMGRPTVRVS